MMVEFIHAIAKKNFILIVNELKWLVQLQCYGDVLIELLLTSSCMLLECRIIFTVLNYILVKKFYLLVLGHQGVQIIRLGVLWGVTWGLSFMYLMDGDTKYLLVSCYYL